jgi:hypothetical protein
MPPLSQSVAHQVKKLAKVPLAQLATLFPHLQKPGLPLPKPQRDRLFSPRVTFWLFLSQALQPGTSCREVVRKALVWLFVTEEKTASTGTAAYCNARKRLPEANLKLVATQTAAVAESLLTPLHYWQGRRVKVVDGSALSMPDTSQNQAVYPQPSRQKPGCGFPVMRLVALFSLASGALLAFAQGSLHEGERTLFRRLLGELQAGEVLLADRGFCSFLEVYQLVIRRVDAVLRNHQCRTVGLKQIKRLGRGDRLVLWLNTSPRPQWLPPSDWEKVPDTLQLREITFSITRAGFRSHKIILITTLLDPLQYSQESLTELYLRRWQAELFLRDIKIALNLQVLRCLTPPLIHRELWMHWIAYNLVRLLMLQAAIQFGVPTFRLSFKGCLDSLREWMPSLFPLSRKQIERGRMLFLSYLAHDLVPCRPNRIEPRAVKRRPKPYQLLTAPRYLFKEISHRTRYKKKLK